VARNCVLKKKKKKKVILFLSMKEKNTVPVI
jgi:hypothetical protein